MNFLKNRTAVGAVCIVLSMLICFGVAPLFNSSMSQKTTVVRVSKEIKAGEEITKDMVSTAEVGSFNLPENIIIDKEQLVGQYATADLSVGDYILNTKITDVPASENAYLYSLNGEKQAMSVTVKSFANGLSGKLQSGDIVSIIAPDYKELGQTVTPPELQYVEVIAVTAGSGYDANTGDQRDTGPNSSSADEDKELPSTVTLLVTPNQSHILAELEADSRLHVSLVYRGTKENAKKFIDIQEQIVNALAVPEMNPTGDQPAAEDGE